MINTEFQDDTASSNIYETPYAAVDVVGPSKASEDADEGNENGSVCFTSYGVINAAYGASVGAGHSNRIGRPQPSSRPLMEWVVKKRTDGTRYITRRPVRLVYIFISCAVAGFLMNLLIRFGSLVYISICYGCLCNLHVFTA